MRALTSGMLNLPPGNATSRVRSARYSMPWKRRTSTRFASDASLTTSAPPSIEVTFLFGWKLKVTRSPNAPTFLLCHCDPRMSPRQREQFVHVDQRARIMRGNDRTCGGCDRGFDLREVDIAGDEIAIHEHRPGTHLDDHVEDGEKALGAGNHLVARPDVAELQRDFDRCGCRGQHPRRPAAAECRQVVLEALHPRSAGDLAGTQHV